MIASPETLEVESGSRLETAEPERVPVRERKRICQANQDAVDENLYLIGRPTLKQFLRFARSHAVNPPDEGTLTDEWQAAHDFARTLEKEEAGAPDNPSITKLELNSKNEPLLTEFLKDPLV